MKKIVIIFVLFSTILTAQNISFQIKGFEHWRASLYALSLGETKFVESITSDNNGLFKISHNGLSIGFYRIVFDNNIWLNFIYDGNDIKIETDKDNLIQNAKIIKSDANSTYFKYLILVAKYNFAQKKLQKAISKDLIKDNNLSIVQNDFSNSYKEYWGFINKHSKSNDKNLISLYINSIHLPQVNDNSTLQAAQKFIKKHFWDNVDFSNALLLQSDLYANKTIEYLNYINNLNSKKVLLEKEYKSAVDTILNKAKGNLRIYKRMAQYLITGFKKLGLGNVIDYLVDNFVVRDDLCLDSITDSLVQMRIKQSKFMKSGIKVPNISLPNLNGKITSLYNVSAKKILVLFYSSYCPHCQLFLPKLLELYSNKNSNDFQIYGISLDTDFSKWRNFLTKNNYNWKNVSDLKGWESKISYDFYIYATPTMFLVNKDFEIIGKPKNFEELKTELSNE